MYMNLSHDAYLIEEESDEEHVESSDDDIDVVLHSTMEQRHRLKRRGLRGEESSSEDEFEKEMASELNAKMKKIEKRWVTGGEADAAHSHGTSNQPRCDDEFLNSDDDDDDDGTSTDKKPALSNDDLLYDPEMDDDDERWINRQRLSYQAKQAGTAAGSRRLPNSDAVLNCPACMSLLCLDCQRHETYHHQYRAMFVMNCSVHMEEVLRYSNRPVQKKTKKNKSKRRQDAASDCEQAAAVSANTDSGSVADPGTASEDVYHPVVCSICNTEVGVYDKDEVYHFFNILASYA